jgi:hypothetical protein
MPDNIPKTVSVLLVIAALMGAGLAASGYLLEMEDPKVLAMPGLFIFFVSAAYLYSNLPRAMCLSRLFKGADLLAHWDYTEAEQDEYALTETIMRKSGSGVYAKIMTAAAVLFAIVFFIYSLGNPAKDRGIALVVCPILAAAGIAGFFAPSLVNRRIQHAPKEAYIGLYGAWVMGEYAVWSAPGMRLKDIRIEKTGRDTEEIAVNCVIPSRRGNRSRVLRIPVPRGKEDEAVRAVNRVLAENRGGS